MEVILLTVFVSLMLALLFLALFVGQLQKRGHGGAERDSLLPLADDAGERAGRPQENRQSEEQPPQQS